MSENPAFARACVARGIRLVGPTPEVIAQAARVQRVRPRSIMKVSATLAAVATKRSISTYSDWSLNSRPIVPFPSRISRSRRLASSSPSVAVVATSCSCPGDFPLLTYPQSGIGWPVLAGVMSIVRRQAAERSGQAYNEEEDQMVRQMVIQQIEQESNAFYATARVWDDGIVDPRDTRTVLGIALSAIVLGTMVLAEARPPLWVAAAVVAVALILAYKANPEPPRFSLLDQCASPLQNRVSRCLIGRDRTGDEAERIAHEPSSARKGGNLGEGQATGQEQRSDD